MSDTAAPSPHSQELRHRLGDIEVLKEELQKVREEAKGLGFRKPGF